MSCVWFQVLPERLPGRLLVNLVMFFVFGMIAALLQDVKM